MNDEEYTYGMNGFGMGRGARMHMHGAHGMHGGMRHYGMAFGRRGALRPIVLNILAESPKSGAEIADTIEAMYEWRPSPGSLYPLLEELAEENVVKKVNEKYELVDKEFIMDLWGKGFGRPISTFDVLNRMDSWLDYFESMKRRNPKGFEAYADKLREIKSRLEKLLENA
ncbi:MAG: PadR family transcriptional regulator [Candidatus Micrarchaeia archaeon]